MMQHPNPQFARPAFLLLDGEWEFQIDNAATYWKRPLEQKPSLKGSIRVPFCPESKLSGVENKDFNLRLWYAKEFDLPQDFAGKRILLRFGASDYHTTVFVIGVQVGEPFGGYSPFFFDVTHIAHSGLFVVVCVGCFSFSASCKSKN